MRTGPVRTALCSHVGSNRLHFAVMVGSNGLHFAVMVGSNGLHFALMVGSNSLQDLQVVSEAFQLPCNARKLGSLCTGDLDLQLWTAKLVISPTPLRVQG